MAAECNLYIVVEFTGTSKDDTISKKFTSGTAPVEILDQSPVVGNTAFTLDLGDIAAGSGYILYLEAVTGNFYFILGATTGTPDEDNSHLYISEGEGYPIPINPDASMMTGIRGVSDSATGKLRYTLVGG